MSRRTMDLIIVSGLSGSGKSVALQSLEDIGYYCVDNLPSVMLPEFERCFLVHAPGDEHGIACAAVSIDSRNHRFLGGLGDTLDRSGLEAGACRILFLDAEEQKLVQRYSETRRKHPLTDDSTPLMEGIQRERVMLRPLQERADKVIDTTDTTPHELRAMVRDFAGGSSAGGPLLLFESFGFKYGSPREADFIFDVRCLPNPHWEESLRDRTGRDPDVRRFLENQPMVVEMTEEIYGFLLKWLPGFDSENRSYITVAVGCTGGQHRSVYICEQLARRFHDREFNAQVRHRQLNEQESGHREAPPASRT